MTVDPKGLKKAARALTEKLIRFNRRWDTKPEDIERGMEAAIEYAWREQIETAEAAISAYLAATVTPAAKAEEGWRLDETALRERLQFLRRQALKNAGSPYGARMLASIDSLIEFAAPSPAALDGDGRREG